MKKAQIIKNGAVVFEATMPEVELSQWLEEHKGMKTFGAEGYSYERIAIEAIPAVYEEQDVLVQEAVYEQHEILDAEGKPLDPPFYEEVLVSPAVYEKQMVETVPEVPPVYETVQVPAEYSVVIEDVTAALAQEKVNKDALKYLADTDWLIIRELDEGTPCPLEIKAARAEARLKIVR